MSLKKYIKKFLKENSDQIEMGTGEFDFLHDSPKSEFELVTYDVWGNDEEGFEVNNAFRSGKTDILYENMTDEEIFQRLKEEDLIEDWVSEKTVEIDGEFDFTLTFNKKENGEPLFELRNNS